MHLIKSEDFKNRIEEYEKSLADMNRKARTDLVITGLIILILIALTAILWMSRQKSRIAHQLAEEQNKRLSQNLEMEQLRNKQQLIEIELRDRRLVADAVQMTENEALLKGIHKTINEAAEGQTNTADVLRELNSQMLMHANNIKEWNTFEAYFEKVHPGFFVQLKKRCPRLTESELRLCAFLRMGMTNAQVASMLNIMPSSLKKSRFRIRKKLELDTADSLEDTLRNISTQ
jgi:DNA-binding NarL/FixJ family response regulator